jgi:hydroxypyruvate isomerase
MIRFSAHLSMLFREQPLAERPAAAHAAGFDTVEAWWPQDGERDAFIAEVRRWGFEVACLNCDGGDIERGERGFLNVPERRDEAIVAFEQALAVAEVVDAAAVNVLVGRELAGVPRGRQLDIVVDVLRELAELARESARTIVVEALNELDVPGALVPSAADAVILLDRVGSDSVRLLYDAYHAAAAGSDPLVEAPALVDVLGHVQYADAPGRGAPGTGKVDLWALVERLEHAGYEGAIGLEFDPRGPTPPLAQIVAPSDPIGSGR